MSGFREDPDVQSGQSGHLGYNTSGLHAPLDHLEVNVSDLDNSLGHLGMAMGPIVELGSSRTC